MKTKLTFSSHGMRSLKLTSLLAALLVIFTSCENGVMNTSDNSSDSFTTDMLTSASNKGPANCENQVNNTEKKLLDCVTLDGVRAHQMALQNIADANGGSREAFSAGYDASIDYVEAVLMNAGYSVERYPISREAFVVSEAAFEQISPIPTNYTYQTDFSVFSYSTSGDVTAPVVAVDLDLGLGNSSTSGCEPSDFAGFPPGSIALLQRGACLFSQKAENAAAAGATAAIIFNQGNTPERQVLVFGTLTESYTGGIPVIGTTYDLGTALAATPSVEARILVDAGVMTLTTNNLLAELPGKNSDNIVMAGAALDSPGATPGINNNGSGAAAVLETAVRMSKVKPQNTVRFAWWADNSTGLQGSRDYVQNLTDNDLQKIAGYLNFDVIASPNYVTFVYDGDNSDGVNNPSAPPAPAGADVIENIFDDYYTSVDQPTKAYDLWFASASRSFLLTGVPSGGIYTGTFEVKSPDEAAVWGGVAGEPYDPCSFLSCDTFDNVSLEALDRNSDAVAYSILNMAMNTNLINGTKAKGNFKHKTNETTE